VHHRVLHDAVVERAILLTAGKFAVKQQVAGLDEVAVLGKLVDRVSAIEQDALVAVDKRDLRLAARGRGEARVVGKAAGVLIERVDVDEIELILEQHCFGFVLVRVVREQFGIRSVDFVDE